jgi:NAD(P)-dependent dehydrogenase (short-subunit alcohol dehydrogenase family)
MIALRLLVLALLTTGLVAAGCGGDDEEDEAAEDTATTVSVPGAEEAGALQEEIADLSDEEQIARVGEEWADRFGNSDQVMCGYLHPDLGSGVATCDEYLGSSLTQSSKLQASFAGATVESVEIKGETALAEFSIGHRVELAQDPDGAWKVVQTPRAESLGSSKVIEPTLPPG